MHTGLFARIHAQVQKKICKKERERELSPRFSFWNVSLLLLSSMGVCLLSLLLALGMYEPRIFLGYFRIPLIFLLNWLPIFLLQLLLLCLFNRQWISFLLSGFPVLAASIGNFYALKLRGQPFSASLIREVPTALRIASDYDLTPNSRVLLSIAALIGGTVFLFFLGRGRLRRFSRVGLGLLCLASLLPLWHFVYSSEEVYEHKTYNAEHVVLMMPSQVYASKGFVYPFLHSFVGSSETAPAGYDPALAQEALSAYRDGAIPADKMPHVLIFQLESFCDLESIGVTGIDPSVYENFRRLQQESLHGQVLTNVFGGGTLKTEHCFLTGNVTYPVFTGEYPSYIWYVRSQGYHTSGVHPHNGGMYNRQFNNPRLGFDEYFFFEDCFADQLPDGYFSDRLLYPLLLDMLEEQKAADEPLFSFNVTMQGHGPYESQSLLFEESWKGFGEKDELYYCLNNYLGGVRDSWEHLSAMVEKLRHDSEPVVLLLFGDHLPHVSPNQNLFQSFGINVDQSSKDGWYNHYATPWLIWANNSAKALYGKDFVGQREDTSINYLMNLLFRELEWEGPAFLQLTEEIRAALPLTGSSGPYVENGSFTTQLSPQGEELLNTYQFAQYYLGHSQ